MSPLARPLFLLVLAAASPGPPRSILDGIYSSDQAERGRKGYNSQCARCHGENLLGNDDAPPLVDQDFLDNWNGKSVGRMVEYTRKKMPSDGPGRLSRQLCTDVVAYLLSANGYPAGDNPLPPDVEALDQIQIVPKK